MKLEDQVLSINQVRELQELGFDVEKHSSVEHAPIYNNEFKIVRHYLRVRGTGGSTLVIHPNKEEDVYIPTMSIGDILNILPEKINKKYSLEISKNHVDYCDEHTSINCEKEEKLIDSLFEMLKWCIKEKHIAL